tara:strand:+ start:521 stop:910 length:390 start_codon:yes stop_codon:yes gene_type:complete
MAQTYAIYNEVSGEIRSTFVGSQSDLELNIMPGEAYILGSPETDDRYVRNGVFVKKEFTAAEHISKTIADVRVQRDCLLIDSDWTQVVDSPLSDTQKSAWATYRQTLRDIPANNADVTSIDDITWPTPP